MTHQGTNWVVKTIGGGGGNFDGTNLNSIFQYPNAIALDAAENLYITDSEGDTVRKMTRYGTNWVTSTLAGLRGASNFGSSDGTNSAARFYKPNGITVDAAGSVYVADLRNDTVRKMDQIGTNWVVTTIAGLAGASERIDGTNSDARFVGM